jgi:hypothetical protein
MLDHSYYVPILKGKEAEYGALKELKSKLKDKITPLWEVPTIPFDFQNDRPAKTIDEHLEKIEERILGAWMFNRPTFIDFINIYEDERMENGGNPIDYVFEQARLKQLLLVPVSGFNRGEIYQEAVRKAHQTDKLGVCLRINNEDFEDLAGGSPDKDKQISELLNFWGVKPNETDIILDFGAITDIQSSSVLITAIALISSLVFVNEWRSLTFAATAFPKDLRDISADSIARLTRTEWQVWKTLLNRSDKLRRIPNFGDYGINYPIHSEIDPRTVKMSAGLRYTSDDEWLVFKGRNVIKYGHDQFNRFCADLIKMKEYKGKTFSWGDKEIDYFAHTAINTGGATTWRKIGFNHHFAMVVDQLATLNGS